MLDCRSSALQFSIQLQALEPMKGYQNQSDPISECLTEGQGPTWLTRPARW